MKYHGNNPVGIAISADTQGNILGQVLRILDDYKSAAQQGNSASCLPETYRRNLAAADCAAVCASVVKEFHAVCVSSSAEQPG